MDVPGHHRSPVSVDPNTVKTPSRSPQGGEGLTDPVVLRILEVVGQNSLLVLEVLENKINLFY